MNFEQANQMFVELTRQWREGKLDDVAYYQQVRKLRVIDKEGRLWALDPASRQWLYLADGQWRRPSPPPAANSPGWSGSYTRPIAVGLVVGTLAALCILSLGVGWLFWDDVSQLYLHGVAPFPTTTAVAEQSTSRVSSDEDLFFTPVTSLTVAANSASHSDAHGVSLTVPSDAFDEGGGQVDLKGEQLGGQLYEQLTAVYNFESLVYQVTAVGDADGAGKAELSFPFNGEQAVVMVIIDDQHFILLDQTPENGAVKLHAHLGPAVWGKGMETYFGEDDGETGTIRYALLSRRPEQRGYVRDLPIAWTPGNAVAPRPVQARDSQDCSDVNFTLERHGVGSRIENNCRTNADQSVIVTWQLRHGPPGERTRGVTFTQAEADQLIQTAEALVKQYHDAGFIHATIPTRWFGYSLTIVLTPSGDPVYNFKNGVLYMPVSSARSYTAANPPVDLLHELAHWVQHKQYSFLLASLNGPRRWWLEISAEIMVFMVEPKNIDINLQTYRHMAAWQKSPFQWAFFGDQSEYVHAHQVWVAMCDDLACPLSRAEFINEVNTGSYPFLQTDKQHALMHNLDDYALYLLNHTPVRSNTAARTNVRMGDFDNTRVGELVSIGISADSNFDLSIGGNPAQMSLSETGVFDSPLAVIDAEIEVGGVYPFTVATGALGIGKSHLPAVLIVEPGPPFWLKIGEDTPVRYDGGKTYTIQPISPTMGGHPIIRIVALGIGNYERFKAKVGMADLQGDWLITDAQLVSVANHCEEFFSIPLDASQSSLPGQITHHLASQGSYVYQRTNGVWSLVLEPGAGQTLVETIELPMTFDEDEDAPLMIPYQMTYSGDVTLDPNEFTWEMEIQMVMVAPEQGMGSGRPVNETRGHSLWLFLGLLGLALPAGWRLGRGRSAAQRRLPLLLALLALPSLACFLTEIVFQTQTQLDKLEHVVPLDQPLEIDAEPIFRLSGGQTTTTLTLTILLPADDEEQEPREVTCPIEIVTDASIGIYHDGIFRDYNMFEELDDYEY